MKFTLSWLKDHLETEADLETITETLTALGLEVEKVVDQGEAFKPFVIAEVTSCKKHPNADKLSVCVVDDGSGPTQVVCGAPNARAGMKGVFAPSGTHIPGTGIDLKPTDIRGVTSNGMLCSEAELMISDDHDGIIDLPGDAPVGKGYAAYAGLDDPMIEIAITPNRQDCLGVHGIARDLAAAGLGTLIETSPKPVKGTFKSPTDIKLNFKKGEESACPVFVGRMFKNVKNGESPDWLKARLRAIGLRPISALVDITNYVSYDRARPLHVYDADKLNGTVQARIAKKGENYLALDENTYTALGTECVIADDKNVLGFGGVMGGEASGCTGATTNVLLEVALFDPILTAMTGRQHGIESDARYRFERGIDVNYIIPGMELASALIIELCGGEASEPVIAGSVPKLTKSVSFRPERIKTLGGIDIPAKTSLDILKKLGFAPGAVKNGASKVGVPSWRTDIVGEADLVEEVLRVYGYDEIPILHYDPAEVVPKPTLTDGQKRVSRAKRALAAAGFAECVTYSFMTRGLARQFGGGDEALLLENPISSEMDCMRPSILPNLIEAAVKNIARGGRQVALFEVGPAYADDTLEGQSHVATGVQVGPKSPRHWKKASQAPDAMDAKAAAFQVLEAAGFSPNALQISSDVPAWYHPYRSGTLKLGPKNTIGVFGEVHPGIAKKMGAKGPIAAFEVFLDNLPQARAKKTRTKPTLAISDLPQVDRDFAFVVDAATSSADITRAVQGAAKAHITDIAVFDVFTGKDLPEGKKSVALTVRLSPQEKTFTDAEIDAISQSIIAAVTNKTGGELRS